MCQIGILQILGRKWMTSQEISQKLGICKNASQQNLKKLRKRNMVKYKKTKCRTYLYQKKVE